MSPGPPLTRGDLDPRPWIEFERWLELGRGCGLREPAAVALATADVDARPSVRMVLLKSFDEDGFVFATHYDSRKGGELTANPQAALLFYWDPLNRQVRVEGPVEPAPASVSDAIFRRRPRGARIGAWASLQSEVIPDRRTLEARVAELERTHGEDIPRPPRWGAFRLRPSSFEFWVGRPDRLHDRFRYAAGRGASWNVERLSP